MLGPVSGGWTIQWWEMEKGRYPSLLSPLLASSGRGGSGQGRIHAMYDNELAQDCKHKEIIKGANKEGNEGKTDGPN